MGADHLQSGHGIAEAARGGANVDFHGCWGGCGAAHHVFPAVEVGSWVDGAGGAEENLDSLDLALFVPSSDLLADVVCEFRIGFLHSVLEFAALALRTLVGHNQCDEGDWRSGIVSDQETLKEV